MIENCVANSKSLRSTDLGGSLEEESNPAVNKPSPCLHNWNDVDDWMSLDEWNSWFKSQVRNSKRNQDIVI
ncbi:hypothetical protein TNCV_3715381 [Trichonephila clavipes]|nr:hypothetical protein TNCV_3715381 [Trichonephila clavipes]